MASVCGSTLSLMDAGVPIHAPVAGVAMGLIKDTETGKVVVLTDIQGLEDFLGDMDFKVAGTMNAVSYTHLERGLPFFPRIAKGFASAEATRGLSDRPLDPFGAHPYRCV